MRRRVKIMSLLKTLLEQKKMKRLEFSRAVCHNLRQSGDRIGFAYMSTLVKAWEDGHAIPSLKEKVAICAVLGVAETEIEFGIAPLTAQNILWRKVLQEDLSFIENFLRIKSPDATWNEAFEVLVAYKNRH
jgi:hypothetical protein